MFNPKGIYTARNTFINRNESKIGAFTELPVKIKTIESALLLLNSHEDMVLIAVFKHLTEFIRRLNENLVELRERNMLQILLDYDFFISNSNVLVRRFCLYIATAIIESADTLFDYDPKKMQQLIDLCLRYYLKERDDFCIEYLSVIINKCLDDPQLASKTLANVEYLEMLFDTTMKTDNADILLHSLHALRKLLLQIQSAGAANVFGVDSNFPTERLICELSNEFAEIRTAALQVIKYLLMDTSEQSQFARPGRSEFLLQRLTKTFCDNTNDETTAEIVDTLSVALRTEKMTQLFFEHNLFDRIIQHLQAHTDNYSNDLKCRIASIFAEIANCVQYLNRLNAANITEMFLDCFLQYENPATHIITGLNRIMKFPESANKVVNLYSHAVLTKLLRIMKDSGESMKSREQAAVLVGNLLSHAFHSTAQELMQLDFPSILSFIFDQGYKELSIDYILMLLSLIETLAHNNEYRSHLAQSTELSRNLSILLKNSFAASIVVSTIFRCLCTLVEEETVRNELLLHNILSSMKRGLKSLSNLVKTAVTNFIIQTTRFAEFVQGYIDDGILEVLIMQQKYAFCVSTWGPAIESILSKCPTLKFCIRNHLSFTDTTVGNDFHVSKKKFDDFRILQCILKENVSPLQPIFVVNFERPENPSELVVKVPIHCFLPTEIAKEEDIWCYCKQPGDEYLPKYLDEVNRELQQQALQANPMPNMKRSIDFENIAKRAKIVAEIVAKALSHNLEILDINSGEECCLNAVKTHLRSLTNHLHCSLIPLGHVRTGCQFERAVLFKALADQIGLPCTLQRSVDGKILFNEISLPVENDPNVHCDFLTMQAMPWRMLRPTHIVDLIYNVGDLYQLQSRQALQYLRLY